MEQEDYCSYELALKLKECGFDEPCRCCYIADKNTESNAEFTEYASEVRWNSAKTGGSKYPYVHISAPTLTIAQKWLREEYGIHIDVWTCSDYSTDADGNVCDRWGFWGFKLYAIVGGERMAIDDDEYDSYECALSAGIYAALELIEQEKK